MTRLWQRNRTYESEWLRARVGEAKGDLAQAESDFTKAAENKETAEEGYLTLGRFLLRHNRTTQAVESWRKGLAAVPGSTQLRGALVEVLRSSGDEKDRQEAVRLIDERLAANKEDPDFLLLKADVLSPVNPKEAEKICEDVARTHPNTAGAFARLAQFAAARGQADQALQIVERGLGGSPRTPMLLLLRSQYLLTDSPNRAATAARELLDLQPGNEAAVLVLAEALVKSGAWNEAMSALTKFLGQVGTTEMVDARVLLARLHVAAAGSLLKSNDAAKATESLRLADDLIRQAGTRAPDLSTVVQTRLTWHRVQGQWKELTAFATEHLRKKPDDLAVANLAGSLLMQAEDPAQRVAAVEMFKHLVGRRPKEAAAYSALGLAYLELGQFAEAKSTFEQGLALEPKNLRLINDLCWLLCEEQHDPKAAAKVGEKAAAEGADEPFFWDTWGVVLYRLGRLAESRTALEKAVAHPRVEPAIRQPATLHLARTIASTDRAEARRLLDELLKTPTNQIAMAPSDQEEARKLLSELAAGTTNR